jgi:hypothetical protein
VARVVVVVDVIVVGHRHEEEEEEGGGTPWVYLLEYSCRSSFLFVVPPNDAVVVVGGRGHSCWYHDGSCCACWRRRRTRMIPHFLPGHERTTLDTNGGSVAPYFATSLLLVVVSLTASSSRVPSVMQPPVRWCVCRPTGKTKKRFFAEFAFKKHMSRQRHGPNRGRRGGCSRDWKNRYIICHYRVGILTKTSHPGRFFCRRANKLEMERTEKITWLEMKIVSAGLE